MSLGFTALEAGIYTTLLGKSPLSGYAIAKELGKPAANTYKAIESLQKKGAIIIDDGGSRLCRAVPTEELLSQLDNTFRENRQRAAKALAELRGSSDDERVYQLKSRKQVIERCRRMLSECQEIIILDLFPVPLQELKTDIEVAAKRGVTIGLKVYEPTEIKGVETFLDPNGKKIIKRWPGQWINLVADCNEYMLAFLTSDGKDLHQAIWSASPYFACVYHSALGAEMIYAYTSGEINKNADITSLQKEIKRLQARLTSQGKGYETLLERFAGSNVNQKH